MKGLNRIEVEEELKLSYRDLKNRHDNLLEMAAQRFRTEINDRAKSLKHSSRNYKSKVRMIDELKSICKEEIEDYLRGERENDLMRLVDMDFKFQVRLLKEDWVRELKKYSFGQVEEFQVLKEAIFEEKEFEFSNFMSNTYKGIPDLDTDGIVKSFFPNMNSILKMNESNFVILSDDYIQALKKLPIKYQTLYSAKMFELESHALITIKEIFRSHVDL